MRTTKIIIAGGTGFLGNLLISELKGEGTEIVVLTRSEKPAEPNVRYVKWDGKNIGDWTKELDFSDALINLVGKSVNCRYNKANKEDIVSSRVEATKVLGQAIEG